MKTFYSKKNVPAKMLFTAFFVVSFLLSPFSNILAQGVTPDHIAKMKAVTGSTISADGNFVAYTVSVPADAFKENATNKTHLYVLNTTTGESKPYFTSSGVSQVTFRPAKGTITFLTKQSGDSTNALYELSLTGGEATKLFSYNTNISNYSWQTDGNRLAFSISEKDNKPQTPLSYSPDFYEEDFNQRKGFIVNLSENNPQPQQLNVDGNIYMMNWSPDGSKIAVSAAPTSSVDDSYMKQGIFVVSSSSRNVIATIDNEGKLGQIEWSPDNNQLAIKAANDLHDPIDGRILIVSANGGKPAIINPNYQGKYESIKWTDANTIHYLASEGTSSVLGTIRPDGTGNQQIFKSDAHNITSFSRASNGAISFTASSPQHPTEVFTLTTKRNASPQKRTNNNPWLSEVQLGKQEVITYKTRDGKYDIQGILMYPLNHREGTKVPLITVVHGGPEAHYTNGWLTAYSIPGQMATAKGYAVFYPNYRGSTGRGVEFAYSSQGDLAGKEFDDIVDGVDYLIAEGVADEKRIGVTGGSYGGYASAWMSTYYSDRFAAAVMFVGISNNLSKWGTSDIPEELYLVHSRKRIWNDWEGYLKRSPVYYVDRSQTPILIMHGANDPRVHPAQSMELYRHLKVRKPELPVRLIYYPGEGHGNRNSGSKYDYNLRMLQWFDTYLMTGDKTAAKPDLDLPVKK
ncbi:S9 family peptidase [uncultured Planktosalinus sp.]|uniref:S9 family peptidase n=1 Tax=uncultured Planktosalinus sp. TaxID=1810935 RepID=UPI0030DC5665